MSYTGQTPDTEPDRAWLTLAPCKADPDVMYETSDAGIEAAKAICYRCPVMDQCGEWALENREPYGTWGGLSEQDRRKIWRHRRIPPRVVDEEPRPRTFQSLYDERTVPLRDGHMAWTGAVPIHCDGAYHTPTQIAFRVDRGRPADGMVRRTCDREGCVLPAHLMDQRERRTQRQVAAEVEAVREAAAARAKELTS